MLRQLERLLKIDSLIRSKHRQTATSLANELEVSERTIRTDLDFLLDRYHAPIEFTRREGYYYTDSEWRLPTISLSKGELFALTVGARMLEAYAVLQISPSCGCCQYCANLNFTLDAVRR